MHQASLHDPTSRLTPTAKQKSKSNNKPRQPDLPLGFSRYASSALSHSIWRPF
jgi:hypothetical protein